MRASMDDVVNVITFQAGRIEMGLELISNIEEIARNDYKWDERYIDDFTISLREIKQLVNKIGGSKDE